MANTLARYSHWRARPPPSSSRSGARAPSRPTSATPRLSPAMASIFSANPLRGTWRYLVRADSAEARALRQRLGSGHAGQCALVLAARSSCCSRLALAAKASGDGRAQQPSVFVAVPRIADASRRPCSNARHTSSPSSSTACSSAPPVRRAAVAHRCRMLTPLRAPQAPSLSSPCRRSGAHTAGSRPNASPPHTHVSVCQQGGASRLRRRQERRSALLAVLLLRRPGRRIIADVQSGNVGSRAVRLTAFLLLQCRSGSARRSASSMMRRSRQTRCEGTLAARSRAAGR
jgi:hypothetical protein